MRTVGTSETFQCPVPYKLIGDQCLFFSRPFSPWGITNDWKGAYLNYYNALEICQVVGGGRLAGQVKKFEEANAFCLRVRGGCAPSLVSFQNPI